MDHSRIDRIEAIIRAHIAEGRQHGASFAIAHRGGVIAHRVLGEARAGAPAGDDTLWLLYSNTKVITACAVWMLAEEGRIRFEDPVALHIPGFSKYGKGGITIIQLLSHQGGFPNAAVPPEAWEDPALLAEVVCDFTLEFTPGSRVHYHAAAAHWVAAVLIRRVTGQDHRDFIRERIIRPLGLEKELFVGLPDAAHPRASDMHDVTELGLVPRMPECGPAHRRAGVPGGGGYATARAMALFYQSLLGNGPRLVSRRTIQYVTRNFTGDRPDLAQGVPMHRGLGPHSRGVSDTIRGLGTIAHPLTFGHGGVGSSYVWGDPDSGLSFAFLSNARQSDEDWHVARMDVLSNLAHAALG
ncbi:class A beta-lactamase-related serine hydrolase [Rhodovarius crocodyli]|uniref:Class A beta-lactamase-related serine hydrolase n=1 Tax=Rhodovarius crocodyli TaxID=1979269 RepID=A0A437MJ19_9PROT|nr:serine hydrolase domain-containing protein [Rhodovarius crocodyli]RVT97629.1 class A beta-lactamase-related serine hydrolase [Rhodovarius crocodyli]